MATEQPKTSSSQQQQHEQHPFTQITSYPPPPPPHGHPLSAYPPPGSYASYYPYPPPPSGPDSNPGTGDPAGQPGTGPMPVVVPFSPHHGVVYYHTAPPPPPPQGQPFQPYSQTLPAAPQFVRPKRKQVKMACTNCASACKRCDEHRPCERCTKFGIAETCVDGQRKERKKGLKRGPYKRKNKPNSNEFPSGSYPQPGQEGEWSQQSNGQQSVSPPTSVTTTTAAIHAVAQFGTPEGYPYYYTQPPPGFMPPLNADGQPAGPPPPPPPGHPGHPHEGGPGVPVPMGVNGQPMVQYYVHPGAYAPFPYFAHPGGPAYPGHPPHPGMPPPQHATMDPSSGDASKKSEADGTERTPPASAPAKKKKSTKGMDGKVRKTKPRAQKTKEAEAEVIHVG